MKRSGGRTDRQAEHASELISCALYVDESGNIRKYNFFIVAVLLTTQIGTSKSL